MKRTPWLLGYLHQALDYAIHPAHREPYAAGKLGVLEQRVGGGSIEGAETQVHILEGEGRLQVRVMEVVADVGVMPDQRLEVEDRA